MLSSIARKIFGSANERIVKGLKPTIQKINSLEESISKLSDLDLKAKTDEFRARLAKGEALDEILPESFAVVREAAKRVLGMRHFDVQLVGGAVLHKGYISEMKTGEGKTLVATLPVYLNALAGKGVHVVTVNDYLARRDSEWMGKVYKFLGLTVGCIVHELNDDQRRAVYGCDVTYATNNELGFDYLRDNMKYSRAQMVQRPFNFAIVDEVDSILIDEARTPLIISGPAEDDTDLYVKINKFIPKLSEKDFEKEEKTKTVFMTDDGVRNMEKMLQDAGIIKESSGLYDMENIEIVHHVNQSLRAHKLFHKDVDYIVKDDQVLIIDEFTGRIMEGRRYSDGLHQSLEAKEGVEIQEENQTLASITFQNYFRLYPKLAGMTGTAMTEAAEFMDIYKLDVVEIPTNVPVSRKDYDDEIYRTMAEKYEAISKLIEECQARNQPSLVGTISIERSEYLSSLLKKRKIPHNVLNARYHEQEAQIISQAGRPGAVTIATNMAGRGTDIMLGGNPEMMLKAALKGNETEEQKAKKFEEIKEQVAKDKETALKAGGLYVIGTERHESRRIDNQLRGRSGRQGDPGASKFFLSLQDDLMRIFGSQKMDGFLQKLGLKEGEAIFHPWMSKALAKAQERVEGHNYEMRKNLLKFDDVMNDQRKVIYEQRIDLMEAEEVSETVSEMRNELITELVSTSIPEKAYAEQWDMETLEKEVTRVFAIHEPIKDWAKEDITDKEILERLTKRIEEEYQNKIKNYGEKLVHSSEKRVLLYTLDQLWKDHLHSLDHLRQGINLRAYGQKDPLNEYKRESFIMFQGMLGNLREQVVQRLSHLEVHQSDSDKDALVISVPRSRMVESRVDPAMANVRKPQEERTPQTPVRIQKAEKIDPNDQQTWGKVGRNDACPCGSGKKYKHCHGALV